MHLRKSGLLARGNDKMSFKLRKMKSWSLERAYNGSTKHCVRGQDTAQFTLEAGCNT